MKVCETKGFCLPAFFITRSTLAWMRQHTFSTDPLSDFSPRVFVSFCEMKKEFTVDFQRPELTQLISIARQQGYLTYEQVNEFLPDEANNADRLDDLVVTLETLGVGIVEAPAEKPKLFSPDTPNALGVMDSSDEEAAL